MTITTNRHSTVVKSKSDNRPYEWTPAQKEAHEGIKPGLEQQMIVNWDNVPKEKIDVSLGYKLNTFLTYLSVSILTRRNCEPSINGIVGNFLRRFKSFKGDNQKLFDFFERYAKDLVTVNLQFPMPDNFQVIAYEPRRLALMNLRKDGVKNLKEILGEN